MQWYDLCSFIEVLPSMIKQNSLPLVLVIYPQIRVNYIMQCKTTILTEVDGIKQQNKKNCSRLVFTVRSLHRV